MRSHGFAASRPFAALALALAALAGCAGAPAPGDPPAWVYVQNVSDRAAVVSVVSYDPVPIEVSWGDAAALSEAASGDAFPNRMEQERAELHAAPLTGLEPDTRYRYRVRSEGRTIAEGAFRTAPLPGTRPIAFAVVGDSGVADVAPSGEAIAGPQRRVVEAMLASTPVPELVLHTGDVVYPKGEWRSYRLGYFLPFAPLGVSIPVFPTIGNHDVKDPEKGGPWLRAFVTPANNEEASERYYSFDWGDVHFVALDVVSTPYGPGTPQREWLERDLADSLATWKIVYFHYPPFSDSSHGDHEDVKRELVPVFERYGVDAVLAGHDHAYCRMKPVNGVLYIVTGGGGAKLYRVKPTERLAHGQSVHHFVRGRADARSLTFEAVYTNGTVFDAVRLEKE